MVATTHQFVVPISYFAYRSDPQTDEKYIQDQGATLREQCPTDGAKPGNHRNE